MFWAECRRERKGRFEQVQIVMHNTCHIKGSHSETANGVRLKESIWEEKKCHCLFYQKQKPLTNK